MTTEQAERPRPTSVALSPDGTRIAGADAFGLFVASYPDQSDYKRVANLENCTAVDLTWSPTGTHIAFAFRPTDPMLLSYDIGWFDLATQRGGHASGMAFAWTPSGKSLLIAEPQKRAILRRNVTDGALAGTAVAVGPLADDGFGDRPPRLALSPDGQRLAFTTRRRFRKVSEVWMLEPGQDAATLVTQIPGADVAAFPFWSPKGDGLGVLMQHYTKDRSGIVVFRGKGDQGQLLWKEQPVGRGAWPDWSERGIACVQDHRVFSLDAGSTAIERLGELPGSPEPGARVTVRNHKIFVHGGAEVVALA